jgi:uncharacterized membrane protein YqjE
MLFDKNLEKAEPYAAESAAIHPLDAIRLLRSAGKTLFAQASLHAQLAHVEWEEEKSRLLKMLLAILLGFAGTLCVMVFIGVLVIAYSWETSYRIPASIALIAIYALGIVIAWRRLQSLSELSGQAFAATRAELAMDIAMIRSKL